MGCNISVGSCIAAIFLIIGFLYVFDLIFDENPDSFYTDMDAFSCQRGSTSFQSSPSCVADPLSKLSCCSRNPFIKGQVEKMRDVSYATYERQGSYADDCPLSLPNLATVYLGASVASIRDTVPYEHPGCRKTNKPELVIEPSPVLVGKSWHFEGVGILVLKMFYTAQISGFSIVHPSRSEIPRGFESSAPKDFQVMGLSDLGDEEPFLFGNYTYDITGPPCQTFHVQSCSEAAYQFIEFRFTSNHGNPAYTALYKVRVHGDLDPPHNNTGSSKKDGPK